jgi:DNA-binding NarL/FixJ family response regulator
VLVVDAEPVYALGAVGLLSAEGLRAEPATAAALLEGAARVDGVVVDARLGDRPCALDLVQAMMQADPQMAIVVAIDRVRPAGLADALDAGARALVHRRCSPEELVTAVVSALRGQTWLSAPVAEVLREDMAGSPAGGTSTAALTPRELEVLRALAEGGGNAAIGARLGISEHTVRNHVHALLGKLGAGNRTDALTTAVRRGLIDLGE